MPAKRRTNDPVINTVGESGSFRIELPGSFGYQSNVLSLTSTLVEIETSDTRSLLERAQAADAEAFCQLCLPLETRLLRQAIALCGDASLAEDLAQDTLFEAWKYLRRYNGRCQLFTWLCAILLNRYRNTVRKKCPVPHSALTRYDQDEFQNGVDGLADHGDLPDQAAQLREQAALVRECLRALRPKHQQVIYLRFYVDESLEGIAAALGCSVGTVKSRLFHALDRLAGMNALSAQFADLKANVETL